MKIILNTLMLLLPFALMAQVVEGTISYQEENSFEIKFEGMTADMQKMFPKSMKSNYVLHFDENAAVYENAPEDLDEEEEMSSGDNKIIIRRSKSKNKVFTSFADKEKLESKTFYSRKFLIKEAIEPFPWKIGVEQKMLLDMPCQKATFQDSTQTIVAWFTPAIPVSAGPASFGQLPGLILEIEIQKEKSTRHILATKFDTNKPTKEMMSKPKKGKKVTGKQFKAIVKEKMEEMKEAFGGDGAVIKVID